MERADAIICISENTRMDLLQIYPQFESKTFVTLLACDALIKNSEFRAAKSASLMKPYLMYVGQRGGYKNFLILLKAFADSDMLRAGYELIAIGGGEFVAEELTIMRSAGIAGSVKQINAPEADLMSWYLSATVFVYPSVYEGSAYLRWRRCQLDALFYATAVAPCQKFVASQLRTLIARPQTIFGAHLRV